jgi:pimeloyl-ACP methyl ester carboxylesterase/DNA-binding CsgD family transcriptional regulator
MTLVFAVLQLWGRGLIGSRLERRVMQRATQYAKSGRVSIAYQVVGDGPTDLILIPGFVSHVELAWEEPRLAHFLGRLAAFSRLVLFDKRGTGMSDPVESPPSMGQRMDDIRAVMDAVGVKRSALFGISEGGTLAALFAHDHPERAEALILYGSWARRVAGPDYPYGPSAGQLEDVIAGMDGAWATGEWWDGGRPSPADDVRHRAWWGRYLRTAASPAMARNVIRMNMGMDIRNLLPAIVQPTLILHRTGDTWIDVAHARYLAERIPSASYVELPGSDHRPWLGDVDAIVDAVEVFMTGHRSRPRRHTTIGVDALSRREREVALLASRGLTATEIAGHLFVSKRTVESHLVNIYRKLGVGSKTEVIRRASELGI